mgnify:CR=1 FL=1
MEHRSIHHCCADHTGMSGYKGSPGWDGKNPYRYSGKLDDNAKTRSTGKSLEEVKEKINFAYSNWNERWIKISSKRDAEAIRQNKEEEASQKTEDARNQIKNLKSILEATLAIDDAIDWDDLIDKTEFTEFKPEPPKLLRLTAEPQKGHFDTKITFIDKDFIVEPMDLKSKELVANDIMNKVISFNEMSTKSK